MRDWHLLAKDPQLGTNHENGFTLLETLVTVLIVLLTVGFVLPSVSSGLRHYRLSSSATQLASQIQTARYRALQTNGICSFLTLSGSRQFGVDADGDGDLEAGTPDLVFSLNTGVNFANLTTPPPGVLSGATVLSTGSLSGIGFTPRGTMTTVNSSGLPVYSSSGTTGFAQAGFVAYLTLTNPPEYMAVTVSQVGRVSIWRSPDGTNWN